MAGVENEAVRIGIQLGRGILESMSAFLSAFKESRGTKADRSVKQLKKELEGKTFSQRDKFILHNINNDNRDFQEVKLRDEELKTFDKHCKNYGVDYLYEVKPEGISKLLKKKESKLEPYEKEVLKHWTEKDANGKLIETPDAAKITFAGKDIKLMEFVVEDMRKEVYTLQQRKTKAVAKKKSTEKAKSQLKEKLRKGVDTASKVASEKTAKAKEGAKIVRGKK